MDIASGVEISYTREARGHPISSLHQALRFHAREARGHPISSLHQALRFHTREARGHPISSLHQALRFHTREARGHVRFHAREARGHPISSSALAYSQFWIRFGFMTWGMQWGNPMQTADVAS